MTELDSYTYQQPQHNAEKHDYGIKTLEMQIAFHTHY